MGWRDLLKKFLSDDSEELPVFNPPMDLILPIDTSEHMTAKELEQIYREIKPLNRNKRRIRNIKKAKKLCHRGLR